MQKIKTFSLKKLAFPLFSALLTTLCLLLFPHLANNTDKELENSYIYTSLPEKESAKNTLLEPNLLYDLSTFSSNDLQDGKNEEILNIQNSSYSQNDTLCVYDTDTLRVLNHKTGEIFSISLDEYTALCVLSEMPTNYDIEALKAQAVACRTLAVNKMQKNIPAHIGADICTNSGHCQSFISKEEMLSRYGESGARAYDIAKLAATQTSGVIMFYNSEPILAAFHASSGRKTASSAEIWGGSVDYLAGAESFEIYDENSAAVSNVSIDLKSFIKKLKSKGINPENITSLSEGEKYKTVLTPSGRVEKLIFSDGEISGGDFRSLFSLRSTDFRLEFEEDTVNITCYGYGHGVGMSQLGAQNLAKRGYDFYEILSHYYSGITFGFAI